ncbi:MAG: hypothetical protein ACREU5_11715 [Burkholderiales bacterium]
MPRRSSKKRQPQDVNQLAAAILADAVGEPQELTPTGTKNPAAVALGRLGGLRGGKARATKLSPARRKQIAKKAAAARWKKS